MALLQGNSTLFSLIDIPACNPWWDSVEHLPAPSEPRADFGWRVNNMLANRLLIIPGPPGTGKTETVHEIIRALVRGDDYENQSSLRDETDIPSDIDPDQVCYVPCDDPLTRFVDGFVAAAINRYLAERTDGDFFVFLDGVHRLPGWRDQLDSAVNGLANNFPDEEWHIVATVPSTMLANAADFGTELADDSVKVDLPHHTQKFRDSFFDTDRLDDAAATLLDTDEYGDGKNAIKYARQQFNRVANGDGDASELAAAFEDIRTAVLDDVESETVEERVDHYLLTGGFEPAVQDVASDDGPYTDHTVPAVQRIHEHILRSLEATVYREIPQVVKVEDDLNRIEEPRDLNAVATYLARRGYEETSYKELAGEFDRDSRTVKQKYINLLADFHIIEKATRYELQRERSLRFYFRSPGYVSALVRSDPLETHRDDLIRTAIADHLYRQVKGLGGASVPLEYWRTDSAMIDFVFQSEAETAIPFVSTFTDETGGTPEAFAAFRADQKTAPLEIVIDEVEADVEITDGDSNGVSRLRVPYWVLLLIC